VRRHGLLVLALVAALIRLPGADLELRDRRAGVAKVRYHQGFPVVLRPGTELLVARAREVIPEDAKVRVVLNGQTCTRVSLREGFGLVFWLQYTLLPRTLTCDEDAAWEIHAYGPVPPGAEEVAPGLSILGPT
jgi:hypothetical protein